MKCDETRPQCLRCIKFGVDCDGYDLSLKAYDPMIVAKPLMGVRIILPNIPPAPSSVLKFESEIEQYYFRTFQAETAAELAGVFTNTFWDRLLLQACHKEPFAAKIVIAIAAMTISRRTSHGSDSDLLHRSQVAQQTAFAYKQYQAALQEMQSRLQKNGNSRDALIACLLVCCFETLAGNGAIAHAHALSGQKLMDQWLAEHPYKNLHEVGLASPADHLIEDDIFHASATFDSLISEYLDPRPARIHAKIRHQGDETIAKMPAKFRLLVEARRYLAVIVKRVLHSCREIGESAGDGRLSTTSDFQLLQEGMSVSSRGSMEDSELNNSRRDEDAVAQQRQYSIENHRWRSAFSSLHKKIQVTNNKREQSAAHSLLAYSRALDIGLLVSLDTDNCSCDNFTNVFQELNYHARKAIQFRKSHSLDSRFAFDSAINPPLFICARFCRDRVIRREAISLMQLYGVCEGFWDIKYLIVMCSKIMELEEEGVETDYIPGSARIRLVKETVHPEERWSTFRYIRGTEATARESEFRW